MASISEEHLQEAAEVGLTQPEAEQAWRCFTYIDENGSGTIDESELRYAMQLHGCDKFDSDGSGYLDRGELKDALTSMGMEPLEDEEIDDMFSMADSDADGKLSIDEFVRVLTMDLEDMIDQSTGN
uniref:Troponin C n=2 Tax=Macrostomum lignano TaxID=282301 RepID=A0A1I8HS97_9PLAT